MNYFTLSLLLSGALIASSLYPAAVASLDHIVAPIHTHVEEKKTKTLTYNQQTIELPGELWRLSTVFTHAFGEDTSSTGFSFDQDNYLIQQGATLTDIYALLAAVSQGPENLISFLSSLSMGQLLTLFKISSYLDIKKETKDITDTIAEYMVKRTIDTSVDTGILKKTFSYLTSFFTEPKKPNKLYDNDLEGLLKKLFRKCPERFRHIQTGDVLSHYPARVTSVAYSPDRKHIASGSYDHTIKIWDASTGRVVHTLNGHTDWVRSVAFSPDGSHIASGSWDNTIKIWDASTGAVVRTLRGHASEVISVAYSPDGSHIASGSADDTIKIWNTSTGALVRTLIGHTNFVISVAYSPDGSHIASGSYDDTIKIWDTATGALVRTLRGHASEVISVAFSPDGTRIASGSSDRTIKIWDPATGTVVRTLAGHTGLVYSVAYSPDGSHIASGSWDGTVKIWNTVTGSVERTLAGHIAWVASVAFSPDGSHIASGSRDNTIKIWGVSDKEVYELLAKMYKLAEIEPKQEAQLTRQIEKFETEQRLKEEIKKEIKERIKEIPAFAVQSIIKQLGLIPFIATSCKSSGCAAYNSDFSQKELAKALRGKRLAAQSSDSAAASCATQKPSWFRLRRSSKPRETVSAAAAEPIQGDGFSQDEMALAIKNSLQEQTGIAAPSGMAAAAEVSAEAPAEHASAQPRQYPGGRSIHEEKDNGDDEPLV
jgi:WD40 repeat protein